MLIGICAYVLIQFAIGAWVSRQIKSETDYILAGRQLGTGLAAFSIFATWFGAETVMGSAGRVYSNGLSGAQGEPFAYGLAILIMGALLAVPLWRRGLTTFADLFRQRFSPGVERLTVLLLIPGSVLWAAAQIRGFGQIVGSAAGISVTTGITIGFVVVVAYTMLGGLLADVYTDLVQGIAIVAGLIAVFVIVLLQVGGPLEGLAQVDPKRFALLGKDQSLLAFAEQWAIPICGSLVAIELISRLLACKSPQVARRSGYLGGAGYIAIALIPVYLGLVGPSLVPGLAEGEQIIPQLAAAYLPPVIYIIFTGALISAILSTVDSALLACASLISHNLILHLRPETSEAGKVRYARAGVAALGTCAFVLALQAGGISDLVELASAFATAGIFVATIFGLFTSFGGAASAYAAMITGALVWLAGAHLFGFTAPYLSGVAAAAVSYVAASVLWPARAPAPASARS